MFRWERLKSLNTYSGYAGDFYFVRDGRLKVNAIKQPIYIPTSQDCIPFTWQATNLQVWFTLYSGKLTIKTVNFLGDCSQIKFETYILLN